MPQKQRIAIVGSGISGLSSAWLLNQHHDITLFEKDSRLGGHSNTVDITTTAGTIAVDTGFIVFNETCYPNLVALFNALGVRYRGTDMSFGVSIDDGRLEYSGSDSIATLFAQKRNLLRPRFWKMLLDLLRFYRNSEHWLNTLPETVTLGELLRSEKFGPGFCDDHLLPMGAAIWSTPVDQMLDYPARAFLRFCDNHALLKVNDRPQWQTVVGGSREYVQRISADFNDRIKLNCGVSSVTRHPDSVEVRDEQGNSHHFDHIVFACHADHTLAMLSDASSEERRLLGAFGYEHNEAVLHSDESLMPRHHGVWSSWNYMADGHQGERKVSVSYWMNSLQHLPCAESVILSLNPLRAPRPQTVYGRYSYQHPVFNQAALAAQRELWSLQGRQRSWFCGSYFGYGFHEDGIQSGLAVAEQLGGHSRPWTLSKPSDRICVGAPPQPARSSAAA